MKYIIKYVLNKIYCWYCFFNTGTRKFKIAFAGTSLVVQWLRCHASTAGGVGLIPGQGSEIPHATRRGQNIEKIKNKKITYGDQFIFLLDTLILNVNGALTLQLRYFRYILKKSSYFCMKRHMQDFHCINFCNNKITNNLCVYQ